MPVLGLVAALGPVSHSIFIPSIPSMELDLHVGLSQLQWVLTVYLLLFGLFQLIIGPLSDRIGRRPAFYIGFFLFTLASVGAALATSIEMLVVARAFQAVGAATAMVIPRAAVQDVYVGEETALH